MGEIKNFIELEKNSIELIIAIFGVIAFFINIIKSFIEFAFKERIEILVSNSWESTKNSFWFFISILTIYFSFSLLLLKNKFDIMLIINCSGFFSAMLFALLTFNFFLTYIKEVSKKRNLNGFRLRIGMLITGFILTVTLLLAFYSSTLFSGIYISLAIVIIIIFALAIIFTYTKKSNLINKDLDFQKINGLITLIYVFLNIAVMIIFCLMLTVYIEKNEVYNMLGFFMDKSIQNKNSILGFYLFVNLFMSTTLFIGIKIGISNQKKFAPDFLNMKLVSNKMYKRIKILNVTSSDYVIEDSHKNQRIIQKSLVSEIILPK